LETHGRAEGFLRRLFRLPALGERCHRGLARRRVAASGPIWSRSVSPRFAFSFRAAFPWNGTGARAFYCRPPHGNTFNQGSALKRGGSPEPRSRDPYRRRGSSRFPPPALGKGRHGILARRRVVGMRSSWCPKASVHIHDMPTGTAAAFMMRPICFLAACEPAFAASFASPLVARHGGDDRAHATDAKAA
jgi:hypothetical protein